MYVTHVNLEGMMCRAQCMDRSRFLDLLREHCRIEWHDLCKIDTDGNDDTNASQGGVPVEIGRLYCCNSCGLGVGFGTGTGTGTVVYLLRHLDYGVH